MDTGYKNQTYDLMIRQVFAVNCWNSSGLIESIPQNEWEKEMEKYESVL